MQKFATKGNDKLGDNCFVVSRPVGDSCPPSCEFLGNGCYAEATERIYKNARNAGLANMITEAGKIRSMILEASKKGKSIRWHERGDWYKDGKIDYDYIRNVAKACRSIVDQGRELPPMWFYTHIYSKFLVDALSPYCNVYASVHNIGQKRKAESKGFKLFAWCDTEHEYTEAKPRPTAKAKVEAWRETVPKLVIIDDERFVTCPEIRRGRGVVSCTESKGTVACNMCVHGRANVLFPDHS